MTYEHILDVIAALGFTAEEIAQMEEAELESYGLSDEQRAVILEAE